MIDISTAIQIFSAEAQKHVEDPMIVEIVPYPIGWLFYWNSIKSYYSSDIGDVLLGNGPMLVDKRNGSIVNFGSGNYEEEIKAHIRKYLDSPPNSSQIR